MICVVWIDFAAAQRNAGFDSAAVQVPACQKRQRRHACHKCHMGVDLRKAAG